MGHERDKVVKSVDCTIIMPVLTGDDINSTIIFLLHGLHFLLTGHPGLKLSLDINSNIHQYIQLHLVIIILIRFPVLLFNLGLPTLVRQLILHLIFKHLPFLNNMVVMINWLLAMVLIMVVLFFLLIVIPFIYPILYMCLIFTNH